MLGFEADGILEVWIDRVWRLISNVWYSVNLNGTRHDFFKSSRGIKQGDPLSPSLFVIGSELLSRLLINLLEEGFIPYFTKKKGPIISHLCYVDDIILFSSGDPVSLKLLMTKMEVYESMSVQKINKMKSAFYVSSNLDNDNINMIKKILGFNQLDFPMRYLGCPIYRRRKKVVHFNKMVAKVASRKWSYGQPHTWKRLMDIKDHVEKYILWKIGKGLISFWWDNWTSAGALDKTTQLLNASKNTKLQDFIENGVWNIDKSWIEMCYHVERAKQLVSSHIVRWNKPQEGWLKLNVDGCSKGNPGSSSRDGIIRDNVRFFVLAYAGYYGESSNNLAEAKAILHGLNLCISRGFWHIIMESDSQLMVNLINNKMKAPWQIKDIIDQIIELFSRGNFIFVHTYREGNVVAHYLVNLGKMIRDQVIFEEAISLPEEVKASYSLFINQTEYGFPEKIAFVKNEKNCSTNMEQ
ncbi:uncharacterized protein [Nicotiana tomentosiformis]|uniref:uncharacterized protein n=1 Tax=Nicotiana tomentosiformis TaxID=4098 RepID=UPI00388C7E28